MSSIRPTRWAGDVLEYISKQIDLPICDFPDGGFIIGDPHDEVKGILITWLATPEALLAAVKDNLNLVICHESFYYNERKEKIQYRWTTPRYTPPTKWEKHPSNIRYNIAIENKLTVLQIHYGLDRLYLCEAFMKYLGISEVVSGSAYEKVYKLPETMIFKELITYVGKKTGLPFLRYVGDPDRRVDLVGNGWGGLSLSQNRYWMRRQVENGAQAIICGELDELAMFFAQECHVGLIETSHVLSENIGLREFSKKFSQVFSEVPIRFYEVKIPFKFEIVKGSEEK